MQEPSRDNKHSIKSSDSVKPTWEVCTDLTDLADYIGTASPKEVAKALIKRGIPVQHDEAERPHG